MILFVVLFICGYVLGAQDTGYPSGFMADCPGMNRSTTFSDETKRSLYVVAIKPDSGLFGISEKTCKLSNAGAECVANYIDIKKRKTLVIISGYLDASFSPLVRSTVAPYVQRGRNVIIVEIFPVLVRSYPIAARITKPLGKLLGEFLAELTHRGLSSNRLELLGGSLGAHIASFASVRYTELTNRKPSRLTGLDPAGPCFRNVAQSERINPTVAERVDALHTNIDGFGLADSVGHVDFYANGGEYQPSMVGNFIMPCFVLCSHVRAAFYWRMALLNPEQFIAVRCDTVASARHGHCYSDRVTSNVLGPKTNFSRPGVYYLPTDEFLPYYIGEKALKMRDYGHNHYLMKTARDADLVI